MKRRLVVINIVGLTSSLLGKHTPNLNRLIADGFMCPLDGVFPAVTTTSQASMLTGLPPSEHGIVGNGWYFRGLSEIRFWLQPNQLINGQKVWEGLKKDQPDFVCSQLFWWYNMYAGVDYALTPRPHYPADGRKIPGLYSQPANFFEEIEDRIGTFPFFNFWGPMADIRSSRWIVSAAIEDFKLHQPDLQLVYLPHLDYNLQRLGPDSPLILEDVAAIDKEAGRLIDTVRSDGAEVMVVSEYGMNQVTSSIAINQSLRAEGLLKVRNSLDWELLDPGASRAFAVVDHQIAHIYVQDSRDIPRVKSLIERLPGVEQVLNLSQQTRMNIHHKRSGDLLAIAEPDAWFNYYYWLDKHRAPDFATTVDIHRKPGYDPVELFINPEIRFPRLKMASRLLQKKLGFRTLMDVIPLDPSLIKGSHGRLADTTESGPLLIGSNRRYIRDRYVMTDVHKLIRNHFTDNQKTTRVKNPPDVADQAGRH